MDSSVIISYFSGLTERQREQFDALGELYSEWNSKINVVSRKDIDNLYVHHVLHSLAVGAFLGETVPGTRIIDVGTGGGFPAIPLAILYPETEFLLVDRIGKKLKVADEIGRAIGLTNTRIKHGDVAEVHEKFDYAVSRAVMRLDGLVKLVRKNISGDCLNNHVNGLICLKGGDLEEETKGVNYPVIEFPINEFFHEDFFDTKKVVYVPMAKK
ncbi:MAG: 16S rRNA (guanine(527)-N(7))-methyltransferase RsmG [Muribaculaceae bacterium]|nr:16S rRNA (guanine(527)-N(7))-methyltransferase RsmG [Muribaculaceae bacterium]